MPVRITPAVKILAIACFATFLVQQTADQFLGFQLLGHLALVPARFILGFEFWQILTYAFVHGEVMHLFLNLMMLVFIGGEIEALWGSRRFVSFYLASAAGAGFFYLILQMLFASGDAGLYTPMVGASGAIYGLLIAYGLLFGERTLLFMMLFPMKAKHFVWVLAGVEFMSTVFSGGGRLSGVAHIGGMATGFVYLMVWARVQARRRAAASGGPAKKRSNPGHLKLVIDNKKPGDQDDDGDPSGDPKTWH